MKTFWNGEPTNCTKVLVVVPEWRDAEDPPIAWWRSIAGQEREAVRVHYDHSIFYLDDQDGAGWAKVTEGLGGPTVPHHSLPDRCVVLEQV